MNYLNIIPYDIYTLIYKYVYNDCIKELKLLNDTKRNNKYKNKFIKNIINDENRIYYTSLEIFNLVSLGIINKDEEIDKYYDNDNETNELEELYYLSDINIDNFTNYHYNILITELPDSFKEATCIKLKFFNIDLLLGFDEDDNNDNVYIPLYYILQNELKTWLELIYYTNMLFNEYLLINNLTINVNFFTLYRFEIIIENGFTVLVPYFDEHFI
jgi:hypothetical protein